MLEGGYSATDELKRVDHLIFVTLKYTRTVDIIRNVLKRLQSAFDYQAQDIMEWAHKEGKIEKLPIAPLMKINQMEKVLDGDEVKDIVDFYMILRELLNSEYKKKEEYRKNVAMVSKDHEINIEKLKELAEKTKNYIYYLKELIEEK
jgi:organic radical activating enzyme